jgi:pimeloyl-ACP methyl ester carboxylesterase
VALVPLDKCATAASYLIRGVTAGGANGPTDAEVAALSAALFARNDADALAAVARSYLPLVDVSRESLRSIRVPVLALIGEFDSMGMEAVKRMNGVVPALGLIVLPGATHASSVRPSAERSWRFSTSTAATEAIRRSQSRKTCGSRPLSTLRSGCAESSPSSRRR